MADARRPVDRPPPESRPLLVLLVACAVAAAWITLGPIHRRHHADSLLPTLVSVLHWTPFYWGQDRFGMLLPLLATPIRHPFGNLLLETALAIFGGLAACVLLARYVAPGPGWGLAFRSDPTWPRARPSSDEAIRIATAPGDVPRALLARYGLTRLVVVDRRPTAWLLRVAGAGTPGEPLRERYDIEPPVCPRAEDPID